MSRLIPSSFLDLDFTLWLKRGEEVSLVQTEQIKLIKPEIDSSYAKILKTLLKSRLPLAGGQNETGSINQSKESFSFDIRGNKSEILLVSSLVSEDTKFLSLFEAIISATKIESSICLINERNQEKLRDPKEIKRLSKELFSKIKKEIPQAKKMLCFGPVALRIACNSDSVNVEIQRMRDNANAHGITIYATMGINSLISSPQNKLLTWMDILFFSSSIHC